MAKFILLFLVFFVFTSCSTKDDFSSDGWEETPDKTENSDKETSEKNDDMQPDLSDDKDLETDNDIEEVADENIENDDTEDHDDNTFEKEPCLIESLEGVWVQKNILVTNSKSPIGTTTKSTTTTYNRIEIECSGKKVEFKGMVCEIDMENNSVVKITAPRQLVDSLDKIVRDVEVVECEEKLCLHQKLTAETRGVKLNDPLNDPLPRDGTNYDQDFDGNPGVTVVASGFISGRLFFIQRIKSEFTVEWKTDSIISAPLWFEDNQFTLGSDPHGNGLEKQRDPIVAILDESFTYLKKIDSSMTCFDITELRKSLFD